MKHTKEEQEGYNSLEQIMCNLAIVKICLFDTFTVTEQRAFEQARDALSTIFLNTHEALKIAGKHIITITGHDIQNVKQSYPIAHALLAWAILLSLYHTLPIYTTLIIINSIYNLSPALTFQTTPKTPP